MSEMNQKRFKVTNIQRFSLHDGDGIRTTVFFKGCPLRCRWCHNPETKEGVDELFFTPRLCINCGACSAVCKNGAQLTGERREYLRESCTLCGACAEICPTDALELVSHLMTSDEIITEARRDEPFYGEEGGVTFSGGEPMLWGGDMVNLIAEAKRSGLNTAIETCGFFDPKYIPELVKCVDLFLYDIKDLNNERHIANTGVSNERIISNLHLIDKLGGRSVIRCVTVNGLNTDEEHFGKLPGLYKSLANCRGVELMPYHAMGGSKSERLGRGDDGRSEWVPGKELIAEIKEKLRLADVRVI